MDGEVESWNFRTIFNAAEFQRNDSGRNGIIRTHEKERRRHRLIGDMRWLPRNFSQKKIPKEFDFNEFRTHFPRKSALPGSSSNTLNSSFCPLLWSTIAWRRKCRSQDGLEKITKMWFFFTETFRCEYRSKRNVRKEVGQERTVKYSGEFLRFLCTMTSSDRKQWIHH